MVFLLAASAVHTRAFHFTDCNTLCTALHFTAAVVFCGELRCTTLCCTGLYWGEQLAAQQGSSLLHSRAAEEQHFNNSTSVKSFIFCDIDGLQ